MAKLTSHALHTRLDRRRKKFRHPLQDLGAAHVPNGRVYTHKSRPRLAYPQQIVTTRLLYYLQDQVAQLSRLQRIYPCAR